ncbi:MAG: hypothetical protein LBL86_01530 [Coriobacteriales bacterium]|nr:hypothetical protein [Coriobacteriales bacterium]
MDISYADWGTVEPLPIEDKVEVIANLPRKVTSETRLWLARTQEKPIPPSAWSQIRDPGLDASAKNRYVDSYFTVCVFELRQARTLSIPSGQSREKVVEVSHKSAVRSSYSTKLLIENVVEGGLSGGGKLNFNLKEQLTTSYSIETLTEYSQESSDLERVTVTYQSSTEDRTVQWWDLVKVIGLYRRSTEGTVSLVGLEDYLAKMVAVTYTNNGIMSADGSAQLSVA